MIIHAVPGFAVLPDSMLNPTEIELPFIIKPAIPEINPPIVIKSADEIKTVLHFITIPISNNCGTFVQGSRKLLHKIIIQCAEDAVQMSVCSNFR